MVAKINILNVFLYKTWELNVSENEIFYLCLDFLNNIY